jgi:hypothetical protein
MADQKNQHYLFAYKALPTIFYTQNSDFLFYLERDGKKFLKFWWDHEAEKLDESLHRDFVGLSYEIHDYKKRKLVLVVLPQPKAEPEVYFLALLSKPVKPSILPWKNLARVIALQRSLLSSDGTEKAVLVDITPRGRQVDIRATCKPDLKDFYKKVVEILDKS